MYTKQIKWMEGCEWKYEDYSDNQLWEIINMLSMTVNFEMLEMFLEDNEYGNISIVIGIRSEGIQMLDTPRAYVRVHQVNYEDTPDELANFKKEAYRIKNLLRNKYPDKWVTSSFSWRGFN